jgi:hypothetical protein
MKIQDFYKGGRFVVILLQCNSLFVAKIILNIYSMCLYVFMCVFNLGLVVFWPRRLINFDVLVGIIIWEED